jgi:hypothetical protein
MTTLKEDTLDDLDDMFDSIRGTCELCDHPRCLSRIKSAKAYIKERERKVRIDELENLDFKEASGFLSGGTTIVRKQVVTKRISQLSRDVE